MVPKQSITVLGNPSGTVLGCLNSSGAWTPRTAVTGGAWVHAPPRKKRSRRSGGSFIPSSHPRRCYLQIKKTHTQQGQSILSFFLVFSNLFFFVLSFSAVFDLPLSADCFHFLFFCSDGRRLWVSSSPLFLVVDPAVAKRGSDAAGERNSGGWPCCCLSGGRWVSSSSPLLRVADRWLGGGGRTALWGGAVAEREIRKWE